MTREIATSTGGSSRRASSHTAPRPTMIPSATPPTAATKNPTRASERTKLPVTTASTAARYATRADASLKRDSPSMRVTTTRGAPSRRKTLVAASASVGATIAPSAKAPPQPRSGTIACATTATHTIVKTTRPIERRAIGTRFARRSRLGVATAALKSNGGRKTSSTSSGSSAIVGRPGTNARPRPPSTIRVGNGTPSRRASSYRIAIATRMARTATRTSIRQ